MMNGSEPASGMMSESDEFGRVDIMFARMMIPHHQQAVDMSELALAKATDTDVRGLAERIRDAQGAEIELMENWLEEPEGRMTVGDNGMGVGMSGMLSVREMAALEGATAAEFDRLYLEGMIDHHEGAIQMAQMILNSENPEVAALGRAIVESQSAEIEQMEQMLGE
ncbi:DUF305 domain-containing protein [Agromyces humi]|uniref:DUF305 domain-containing protein n=1 Tax=Agromyces humi TaxID=1766800 RepID=UPI0013581818|nr:DUF305 domain-containing protein [Agromyces humi]